MKILRRNLMMLTDYRAGQINGLITGVVSGVVVTALIALMILL
jgi:hypothetical protein